MAMAKAKIQNQNTPDGKLAEINKGIQHGKMAVQLTSFWHQIQSSASSLNLHREKFRAQSQLVCCQRNERLDAEHTHVWCIRYTMAWRTDGSICKNNNSKKSKTQTRMTNKSRWYRLLATVHVDNEPALLPQSLNESISWIWDVWVTLNKRMGGISFFPQLKK